MWGLEYFENQVDDAMGIDRSRDGDANEEKKSSMEDVDLGDVADKVVGFFSSFTQQLSRADDKDEDEDDASDSSMTRILPSPSPKRSRGEHEEKGSVIQERDSPSTAKSKSSKVDTIETENEVKAKTLASSSTKEKEKSKEHPSTDVLRLREDQLASQVQMTSEMKLKLENSVSENEALRKKLREVADRTLALKDMLLKTRRALKDAREREASLKAASETHTKTTQTDKEEATMEKYKAAVVKLKQLKKVCVRLRQTEKDLLKKSEDDTRAKNMMIKDATEREQNMSGQISELRKRVEKAEAALLAAKADASSTKTSETAENGAPSEELQQLRQRAKASEAEVLDLRQKMKKAAHRVDDDESAKTTERIATLESEIESARAKMSSAAEATRVKLMKLESAAIASRDKIAALERKVAVREKQLATKSSQYAEMHASLSGAEDRAEKLEAQMEQLRASEEAAQKDRERVQSLEASLKKSKTQATTASKRCELLNEKMKLLAENLEASKSELQKVRRANALEKEASERARSDLESQLKAATARLEDARVEAERRVEKQTKADASSRERLERELALTKKQLKEAQDLATRATETKEKSVSDVTRKWQDAEERARSAKVSVAEATRPLLQQLKIVQAERDAMQRTSEATESSLTARLKSTLQTLQKCRETANASEARVEELEVSHSTLSKEMRDLRLAIEESKSSLATANTRAAESEEQLGALRDLVHRLRGERERALEQMREVERILQLKLDTAEREIDALKERVASASEISKVDTTVVSEVKSSVMSVADHRTSEVSNMNDVPQIAAPRKRTSDDGSILAQFAARQRDKLTNSKTEALERRIARLEASRQSISDELVSMSEKLRSRDRKLELASKIVNQYRELRRKHSVLLEMLGEKQEEVDRLRSQSSDAAAIGK
eukprot:g3324.t1